MAQHTSRPSLVAPPQEVAETRAPRLRKRLQKSVTRMPGSLRRKRPGLGASNEAIIGNQYDAASRPPAQAQAQAQVQAHTRLPPPVPPRPSRDIPADSKWAGFFRGGATCLHDPDQASLSQDSPVNIIPEFSHLAIRDAPHHHHHCHKKESRPFFHRSFSQKSAPKMRRRAKTPIFSIGQLENIPRPANALGRTSSVELIAEQYKALIESQESVLGDAHSEPPLSRNGDDAPEPLGGRVLRRQQSSDELDTASPFHAPSHQILAGSPTSDDGTLVSFEEDRVYFKPVSFSPEPRSPLPNFSQQLHPLPTPSDDVLSSNLSLQICLDLLTRDLSSALASRPSRSSPETSALQVWCMIEAYERLRDQLAPGQAGGPVADMFDTWLRALYRIHDDLTGGEGDGEYYEEGEMI
ncbi:hypothetical protein QBC39DRAFT_56732 [Podospora conica]|nr:hypothetical protein QBC39DRAFT_56732 [Schizothecium conicum]